MEEETEKKFPGKKGKYRRTAFTITDWIIAAFSIVFLIYLLMNLPAY